ncbi:MAG: hypothetical protein U0Z75_07975 [Deinococcaceae bacterium]
MKRNTEQHPSGQSRWMRWLLEESKREQEGFFESEKQAETHTHPWWKVMCLTGVDYFSTLGYQPSIAAVAAGVLSPIATLVLVLFTLFGALPMYRRVAFESPHGQGSISMLEDLLSFWQGKLLVLCLIGFAATGFIITVTLSAADATAHIMENPFAPHWFEGKQVVITLVLLLMLGAIFLKGFSEAIGVAVALVIAYIGLSLVVVGFGAYEVWQNPIVFSNWLQSLQVQFTSPLALVGAALLVFPKLALGLSGFETGVVLMPQVRGDSGDQLEKPEGRIRNSRKLLTGAAVIMSVMLLSSSFVATLLIPAREFREAPVASQSTTLENGATFRAGETLPFGERVAKDTVLVDGTELKRGESIPKMGEANGRALAYLAHTYLGDYFGTAYDLSTILILWFAGASAMAGLLNIVPRYLPRYGMAPSWTTMTRPLVLIYTVICAGVTIIFQASVKDQAAAYATGVLVLMGSGAIAVTLSALRARQRGPAAFFGFISVVFLYTIALNVWTDPSGLRIAAFFILAIVTVSLVSRVLRSTELRVERIELDESARAFLAEEARGHIRIIANRKNAGDIAEYEHKEREVRTDTHIPKEDPILFLEVTVEDASDFTDVIEVTGVQIGPHKILRAKSAAVPNAIAALLLYIRDRTGKIPHAYFGWTEGNPFLFAARFVLFGEGDIAPITREILRQAEPEPKRRPAVHVGG